MLGKVAAAGAIIWYSCDLWLLDIFFPVFITGKKYNPLVAAVEK